MAAEGMHDQASRAEINAAAEVIARALLERKLWRTRWRVEVEGCVFHVVVNGYRKHAARYDREQGEP